MSVLWCRKDEATSHHDCADMYGEARLAGISQLFGFGLAVILLDSVVSACPTSSLDLFSSLRDISTIGLEKITPRH